MLKPLGFNCKKATFAGNLRGKLACVVSGTCFYRFTSYFDNYAKNYTNKYS